MSSRVTKCTVCGESGHSRIHCMNLCQSCSGDERKCSCKAPSKKKQKQTSRQPPVPASPPAPAPAPAPVPVDYKKLYNHLMKKYQQVSSAYQAVKINNETWPIEKKKLLKDIDELRNNSTNVAELEEDNEELAQMNRQKTAQIEKMKADIDDLTATITEKNATIDILKLEIDNLKRQDQPNPPEPQPSQPTTKRTGRFDLTKIHDRYGAVLRVIQMEHCTIRNVFKLASISRSTVRDFVAIAELKIVEEEVYTEIIGDPTLKSIKSMEMLCRRRLRRHTDKLSQMRTEGALLPMTFDESFYCAE